MEVYRRSSRYIRSACSAFWEITQIRFENVLWLCRASRRAVIRAKIELEDRFRVQELSSISTLELAWEGYQWGARMRYPDGQEVIR